VSLPVQLAALFHDIERLVSEPDVRVEHHAADYQSFKDAHAGEGARMASLVLQAASIDSVTRRSTAELVAGHERRGVGADRTLLNDADALSFFSLNSPGFLRYYGEAHTRKKVAYTLRRMSAAARARLAGIRLPGLVAASIEELAA
jgi:hypothetical protein